MGGRIHGFLAGTLCSASLAYFTSLEFQKNKTELSSALQSYKSQIENRNVAQPEYRRGDSSIHYSDRSQLREIFADIWNGEIIKGVNWLYGINWLAAGEKLESGLVKIENSIVQASK